MITFRKGEFSCWLKPEFVRVLGCLLLLSSLVHLRKVREANLLGEGSGRGKLLQEEHKVKVTVSGGCGDVVGEVIGKEVPSFLHQIKLDS